MKKSFFLTLTWMIVWIGGMNKGFSQSRRTDSLYCPNIHYLISYWNDSREIACAPFHWKSHEWSMMAGLAGVTTIAFIIDNDIYQFVSRQKTRTSEQISKYVIEPWGSGLYSLPFLAGIYITGHKNNRHRNVALTGIKAYILAGGAVSLMKHLAHRHRPLDDQAINPWKWDGPFPISGGHTSFASGHTTTAFAIASVLASGYKDKPWIGIASYSLAGLVGLSRLHDQTHWASDVVVGAALGTFIGTTLCRLNFKKLHINPTAMRGGGGVSFRYRL